MPDFIDIDLILKEHGIVQSSPVTRPPGEQNLAYAFVEVSRTDKNLQDPSNAQLNKIRDMVSQRGIQIEFILIDSSTKDAEAGVRATILHHLGDRIRNCFMSIDGRFADIWIVPKGQIPAETKKIAEEKAGIFLDNLGLKLRKFISTADDNTPTKTACLSILHVVAPANLVDIATEARRRGFVVPSENWMSRVMDNLRKSGLVTRFKNGSYAITLEGLKAVGTAKNARSPDIRRILDLARRSR